MSNLVVCIGCLLMYNMLSNRDKIAIGTLMVKRQFQLAMDMMAAAMDGPEAAETETIITLMPKPLPSNFSG